MNKKLYCLGDLHINFNHDWDDELFNNFLNWFISIDFGPKDDCELIQLGDVTDKSANRGKVIEFVTKFFIEAQKKFKKIYILGGNHCGSLRNNEYQYSTQFLSYFENIVTIYDEMIFLTENGFKVLALPYKRVNGKTLDDYYSYDLPKEYYTTKIDLICGHVALKEKGNFFGGIEVNKFKNAKNYIFGHIHTRFGQFKDYYTGSVLPNKIDEVKTEFPRIIKCIGGEDIEIPDFIKYDTLLFGEEANINDNLIHIFTITNCKNINQAKQQYPNLYIKGVEKIINNTTISSGEKKILFQSPFEALSLMLDETGITIKRKTMNILTELFKS